MKTTIRAQKQTWNISDSDREIELQIESTDRANGAYEIFDDALVHDDWEGDAEDSDESEVATRPAEVMLEILSRGSPILNELVLVRLHSSTHLLLLLLLLLGSTFLFDDCVCGWLEAAQELDRSRFS